MANEEAFNEFQYRVMMRVDEGSGEDSVGDKDILAAVEKKTKLPNAMHDIRSKLDSYYREFYGSVLSTFEGVLRQALNAASAEPTRHHKWPKPLAHPTQALHPAQWQPLPLAMESSGQPPPNFGSTSRASLWWLADSYHQTLISDEQRISNAIHTSANKQNKARQR